MDTADIECFGFDFKLIPLTAKQYPKGVEAHSRSIFAHELCERERAEQVVQVLEQGVDQAGGVLAVRVDRGTPYLAELTVEAVDDTGAQMRVARAYRPTDKALIERARHHEHAQTVARQLHHDYDFRWSMRRWLAACKGFRAEDLREAARRFDRILLRGCFGCDPKRNPKYLLAIVRTVREEQKPLRRARRQERLWQQEQSATRQAAREQERMRSEQPGQAADKAIELARMALQNNGFGLATATRWLDQALVAMAARGPDAYCLATRHLVDGEHDQRLLAWLQERVDAARPAPRPLKEDLLL